MAITNNTYQFYHTNTKLVGYICSAHFAGTEQETLVPKITTPLSQIRSINWDKSAGEGFVKMFWEGSNGSPNTFICYIVSPSGSFDFDSDEMRMFKPATSTGRILFSTEHMGNKNTYSIVIKGKEQ